MGVEPLNGKSGNCLGRGGRLTNPSSRIRTDAFSSDGLLATGITVTTFFALSEGVSRGSKGIQILAGIAGCLLYMLILGTKEVGIVWGLWLIALLGYLIWTGTRRSVRTVTLFLSAIPVATFWAERVWESKTARIGETPALGRIIPVYLEELEYLTPFNKELALLMIIGSAAGAAWLALWPPGNSSRIRQGAWFALASIAGGLALLLATCITGRGAARYAIPSAYMVIFGAGLVAAWTVERYRALAAGCIVLLAGLCSTGNIIRQTLSYHQMFYEFRDAIAYLDQRGKKGVTLAYDSPALPPEEATNLRLYFEKYGPLYYGTEPRTIVAAEDLDFRPQRLSILTQRDFPPIQTFSASIGLSVCDAVYNPFRQAGLLEDAARTVTGIEAFSGCPAAAIGTLERCPSANTGVS